jgi:hypothetical protein
MKMTMAMGVHGSRKCFLASCFFFFFFLSKDMGLSGPSSE